MSQPVAFLPEARAEFDEAADWYDRNRPGLGARFIAAVDDVLNQIAANPGLHAVVYQDVRKAVVRRFPYKILYREEPGQVLVIAVSHARRNPSHWKSRL